MSAPIITVEGLGKRYRISGARARYSTFREAIASAAVGLWRQLKELKGEPREQEFWALKDVSFEVHPGEVLGVVGRNGAGKSTLLKILSEITEPSRGQAALRGRVASLLEVGTGFHPELTGRENIYLSGAILGMRKAEIARKFDEIVEFSGVDKFLDTPAKFYSSGMYVRLGFAVAAHLDPEILLIDEVLAVGDAEFQKKCLGRMDSVAKSGRTILFVSHQMNSIRRLCSRCLWLDAGMVQMDDLAAKVANEYEAGFRDRKGGARAGEAGPNVAARFLHWEMASPLETDPYALASIGPMGFRFEIEVRRALRDVTHGIALRSAEGVLMWGWATYHLDLEPGRCEFVYDLPTLPLRPGSYHWSVSLSDRNGSLDAWDAMPPLAIVAEPMTHPRDEWSGTLNVPCAFALRQLGGDQNG